MIIGSGLIAQAFASHFLRNDEVCIFAAGVSNSHCTDSKEFERERQLLLRTLADTQNIGVFVYFGTCSVEDPESRNTSYVQHKLMMEKLIASHPRHLILRLPQVAGKTPNPHTLLNYLYARISRSESFDLWKNAKRNIIDIDDVAAIANKFILDDTVRNITFNIANPNSYLMSVIVNAMERSVGKRAMYYLVERGYEYAIDTSAIKIVIGSVGIEFGSDYLQNTLSKYYGKVNRLN